MEQLGRVNLLVGTNNCGKTSVLEAIGILMEEGSSEALWRSLWRRGETRDEADATEFEMEHLFHGHHVGLDATFTIEGKNGADSRRVEARVADANSSESDSYDIRRRAGDKHDAILSYLDLVVSWNRDGARQWWFSLPLTKRGGLLTGYLERPRPQDDSPAVHFITTEALSRDQVLSLLEDAILTPEEDTVLAALRTIEPGIERIAPLAARTRAVGDRLRGGVAVKLAGQRVPIGSLGDGIWRLLGIALALVRARGGVLLVDEIDTGLHYSVLENMWRLVYETARRLDVQVFATTHSRDCYESLAAIAHPTGHDVTIQRIERGKPLAVAFSEAEIVQAAKRGIEVR
jgi:hypothetical protein